MTDYLKNTIVVLFVLFGLSVQAQLKNFDERKKDFKNTPSEYKELIINFLNKEKKSNYYSDNYSKGNQYFFIEKYYLEDEFGAEVYNFGGTTISDKYYMMFCSDSDIRIIDFIDCEEDWQTLIDFINKHIEECDKIPFLNEIIEGLSYTMENNRHTPESLPVIEKDNINNQNE